MITSLLYVYADLLGTLFSRAYALDKLSNLIQTKKSSQKKNERVCFYLFASLELIIELKFPQKKRISQENERIRNKTSRLHLVFQSRKKIRKRMFPFPFLNYTRLKIKLNLITRIFRSALSSFFLN